MKAKIFFSILFIILGITGITYAVYWGVTNKDKVSATLSGGNMYTSADLENAYDEGYSQAISDKSNYEQQIINYKNQVESINYAYSRISELEAIVAELSQYKVDVGIYLEQIEYYQNYITQLENANIVTATFIYEDTVLDFVTTQKGQLITPPTIESTRYVHFNYWEINGSKIDLSTYVLNDNVNITANITYYYDVTFMNNNTEIETQLIEKNQYALTPVNAPTRTGWKLIGYSLSNNGDIINLSQYPITNNVTLYAIFEGDPNGNYFLNINLTFSYSATFTISNGEIEDVQFNGPTSYTYKNSYTLTNINYYFGTTYQYGYLVIEPLYSYTYTNLNTHQSHNDESRSTGLAFDKVSGQWKEINLNTGEIRGVFENDQYVQLIKTA